MDPMDIMREYMLAKEEHERALAAVGAVRQQLETARAEYADAHQMELQMEQDLQSATAKVAAGLEEMHLGALSKNNDASATSTSAEVETTSTDAVEGERAAATVPAIGGFLVEYHRNIGCYLCYLFIEDGSKYDQVNAKQLAIQVDFPAVKLFVNKQGRNVEDSTSDDKDGADTMEEQLWWSTEIERNVDQAKCVIDVKADHIYLRLPVKEGDKDVAGDGFSSFSQITSNELAKSHYSNIVCRACDNVLARATAANPIERVLPLPSANWMDMFDFWGAGLGAFEHLPREDIFAQKARVYVGESHILLHEDNTMSEALATVPVSTTATIPANGKREGASEEEEDSKNFWQPLQCSKCTAALGMRHTENVQTIRLDKHLIASKSASAAATNGSPPAASGTTETDIFARYTVDSVVCTKLLEFADSDGVFRFTLRSSADQVALQLQLLSWEMLIKVKSSPSEFRRVLKVVYASSPQAQTTASPLPVAPAQDLVFAPAVCDAVASRLRTSSTLLPASLRRFNKMDVGYLYA